MNINRDNYESWFLDYLDGKLEAGQIDKFMSFLDFNPDLKRELQGMELVSLEAETFHYKGKETLKKSADSSEEELIHDEFDSLCISSIEKQLSTAEEVLLQDLLKSDPEREKTYRQYQSTLLQADQRIVYPEKALLRKRFIEIPRVRLFASVAAASAVILLAVSVLLKNPENQEVISSNQEITVSEKDSNGKGLVENVNAENVNDEELIPGVKDKQSEKEAGLPGTMQTKPLQTKSFQAKLPQPEEKQSIFLQPEQFQHEPVRLTAIEPIIAEFPSPGNKVQPKLMASSLHDNSWDPPSYPSQKNEEEKRISFWKLADAGIQKINEWSDEDYSIAREVDEQGNTRRFTFESPIFGISTPLGNTNPPR